MNLDWPALETERLILQPWKPEDFEPYARFSADEESMRYLGRDGRPTDAAETWRTICLFIGHWYLRGYTLWAVEEKASGEFVGRVGPWKPEGWPDLEIGWAVDRSRWGRGYATEAARAAADWRSEEHTSELQSRLHLVCRLLLEKKKKNAQTTQTGRHCDERAPTDG